MLSQLVERRRYERTPVSLAGTLICDDALNSCAVLDLSQGGAMLSSTHAIPMNHPVRLKVDQVGVFVGRVTWCNTDHMGISFIDSSDRSAVANENDSPNPFREILPNQARLRRLRQTYLRRMNASLML